jgi:hypothetical protein
MFLNLDYSFEKTTSGNPGLERGQNCSYIHTYIHTYIHAALSETDLKDLISVGRTGAGGRGLAFEADEVFASSTLAKIFTGVHVTSQHEMMIIL